MILQSTTHTPFLVAILNSAFVSHSDEGELQFKTRTSFINVDDYARYVRDSVAVGMMVRCCEASNIVQKDDVGEITTVR